LSFQLHQKYDFLDVWFFSTAAAITPNITFREMLGGLSRLDFLLGSISNRPLLKALTSTIMAMMIFLASKQANILQIINKKTVTIFGLSFAAPSLSKSDHIWWPFYTWAPKKAPNVQS
jgi:hypothetical protein